MKRLIDSEFFWILALLLMLAPQVTHTVYVFEHGSHHDAPWQWVAWSYAVGVDLAILMFTIKGWIRIAVGYLVLTLAHNMVYFFYPDTPAAAILTGVTLSVTIFSFSHHFYQDRKSKKESTPEEALPVEVLRISAAINAGIVFEAQPYRCPECGETFGSAKKLNGHVSGHKMKGEWEPDKYGEWERENEKRSVLVRGLADPAKEST